MELTKDILLKIGFKCDYPDRSLCNFKINSQTKPEYHISISKQYKAYTNKIQFNVDCWLCNDKGIIIKSASLSNVETLEELQHIIDLCKIPLNLKELSK